MIEVDKEAALLNLRHNLREEMFPYFSDEELLKVLEEHSFDMRRASYECLVKKAEDDSVSLPAGLSVNSSREYWLGLAKKYRARGGANIPRGDCVS